MVIGGVYEMYATYGLPLDVVFDGIRTANAVIDWLDFMRDAEKNGMNKSRVLSMIEPPLTDVFGSEYRDVVIEKLMGV